MSRLLIRLFIKGHENTTDPAVRGKYGKLAGAVGLLSNTLLCIAKILAGVFTGSIAVIADGFNNLTDAGSSLITLIGFKLSAIPEDKEHPYGHARMEYLAGLLISVLIIVVGGQLLISSFQKILHPESLHFNLTTVIILVLAILIKVWQSRFYALCGKTICSVALAASSTDSRNDVIATGVVLLSLLIERFTGFQPDAYAGCLVALFIIWSGIQLVRETSSPLLGESPDPELVAFIARSAKSYEGVLGIHDLVVHNYGPGKIFASMHVEVDADGDLMDSHDMIDRIERTLSSELKIHLVIHMDPIRAGDPLTHELRGALDVLIQGLPGILGLHDLRIVPGTTHTNIVFDLLIAPGCKLSEKEIHAVFEKELQKRDPSYFVAITFDKDYNLDSF